MVVLAPFSPRMKKLIQVSKLDAVADWKRCPGTFSYLVMYERARSRNSSRVMSPARLRIMSS